MRIEQIQIETLKKDDIRSINYSNDNMYDIHFKSEDLCIVYVSSIWSNHQLIEYELIRDDYETRQDFYLNIIAFLNDLSKHPDPIMASHFAWSNDRTVRLYGKPGKYQS